MGLDQQQHRGRILGMGSGTHSMAGMGNALTHHLLGLTPIEAHLQPGSRRKGFKRQLGANEIERARGTPQIERHGPIGRAHRRSVMGAKQATKQPALVGMFVALAAVMARKLLK